MVLIVDIGDMHTGSKYGLNPPEYVGAMYTTPFTKWIYEKWEEFCEIYKNPDILILGGDLVDGIQEKQKGTSCVTTDLDEQIKMNVQLLKMLVGKNTKTYGVNGSGYHGGIANSPDRKIIETLGGQFKNFYYEIEVKPEIIQVAHGSRGSIRNPLLMIKSEMEESLRNAQKRKGSQLPTIISRHHLHVNYILKNDCGMYGYINPCWQYSSDFIAQRAINTTPNIGAMIINILKDEPTKIYSVDYIIPNDIHEEMGGYIEYEYEMDEEIKRQSLQDWKEEVKKQVV